MIASMMTFERTAVVGDVHGCVDEFEELVKVLDLRPGKDRLIQVGDLVDKGPDSVGAIRLMRGYERRYPGSETILGNHEAKWLKKMRRGDPLPTVPGEFTDDDAAWMKTLPLFRRYEQHGLFVVHGGIYPKFYYDHGSFMSGDEVWGQGGKRGKATEKLLYTRFVDSSGDFQTIEADVSGSKHWTEVYDGRDGFVVAGHEPTQTILEGPSAWGIDTGCVFGGKLTAVIFTSAVPGFRPREVVQVQAKRVYEQRVRWHQERGYTHEPKEHDGEA
jgi:hypothetical protein